MENVLIVGHATEEVSALLILASLSGHADNIELVSPEGYNDMKSVEHLATKLKYEAIELKTVNPNFNDRGVIPDKYKPKHKRR